MSSQRKLTAIVVWGIPAFIGLTAVALVLTAWSIKAGVESSSELLARGQAQTIARQLRRQLRDGEGDPQRLARTFEDLEEEGLTYMAIFDPNGVLLREQGTPTSSPKEFRPRGRLSLELIGDRARVALVRGRRGRRGGYLYEFKPQAANQLREQSRRVFTAGLLGAAILLAIAAGLARWLARRERRLAEAEHERRLAHLGEMSAVLAHEIKNPLASLKGNAQLLHKTLSDDDPAKTRAERVVGEAVRLEQLTGDLLEFVRSGEIRRKDTDPTGLLESAASAVKGSVELEVTRAPKAWSLDEGRIRQVLVNLIDNAHSASPEAPVSATVFEHAGALVFEIADRGPGVAAGDKERIFDAFFTDKTRGTGLGLAVSKRLIGLHGGSIDVLDRDGGGSIFRVTIPRG